MKTQFGDVTHRCTQCCMGFMFLQTPKVLTCTNCGGPLSADASVVRNPRPTFHETADGDLAVHYE